MQLLKYTPRTLPTALIGVLLCVMTLGVFLLTPQSVSASVVTCRDGSVHSHPTMDYACMNEGGVRSVAPNPEEASAPGDVCPEGFARAGEPIPEGQDGTWCWREAATENVFRKNDCNPKNGEELGRENCAIIGLILDFTNFLSAIVGIVCVIMITFRGIQYTTARDNAQAVHTARIQILQIVIALLVYIFLYSLLQWLVPGGIF